MLVNCKQQKLKSPTLKKNPGLLSLTTDQNNILTVRDQMSEAPLCLATRTVQVWLMSLKLSALKSKNIEEHVWLMLLVSVNTPSHLQSAETLVCLHCLAGCLTNTHTHTSRTEGSIHWTSLSGFQTAIHSVGLPDAQALTDCCLNHCVFF